MRKVLFLLTGLFAGISVYGQPSDQMTNEELRKKTEVLRQLYKLDSLSLTQYDKIITYDKEVYLGKIVNITFSNILYTAPLDQESLSISKSRVSQILYADGRRDVFIALDEPKVRNSEWVDTTQIIIKNGKEWTKVIITENPYDVSHLVKKGNIKANYEAGTGKASNEDLMRQAEIILKKKAALLKAHCVLIDTKFFKKAYGDLPRVEVTAIAYGY